MVASGKGATAAFANEPGGHRYQRVPPTERKGRVHTSTVTVAVLSPSEKVAGMNANDVDIITARGTGKGGQHQNTTESCVTAVHRPTGIRAVINLKSQHQSRALALTILGARVTAVNETKRVREENAQRRSQVGSGMRGDKVRTYRTQDDTVTDHRTGERWRLSRWVRGER